MRSRTPRRCSRSRVDIRYFSSTKCTASTRHSRMRSCRSSSAGCSPLSAPRPRTRRSSSSARCSRAQRFMCSRRSRRTISRNSSTARWPRPSPAAGCRLQLALDAVETYERLGTPEGELALAQAAIYLACAPKSNAVYLAYGKARAFVAEDGSRPVPLHIRNAPTGLMKHLGYGKGYRYAHDEPDAYAAGERYLPEGMPDISFYEPTERGLEAQLAEKLAALRERDAKAGAKKNDE